MKFKKKKNKGVDNNIAYSYDGKEYKKNVDEMSDASKIAVARIREIQTERLKLQIQLEELNLTESYYTGVANKEFGVNEGKSDGK